MWRAGEGPMFEHLKRRVRVRGRSMQKKTIRVMALAFVVQVVLPDVIEQARA